MSGQTPRPWPECARPSAEQLADWLTNARPDELFEHATRALALSDGAEKCFVMNHEGQIEALRRQRDEQAERADLAESRLIRVTTWALREYGDEDSLPDRLERALLGDPFASGATS